MQQEEASQKKQKCFYILGWLKQIIYIFTWIITIIFAKYGIYEETEYYYYYEDTTTTVDFGLTMTFAISISCTITFYAVSFLYVCMGKNRVIKLLSNINEDSSINNIIDNLLREKPEVSISCMCYHMETHTTTYTDANGRTQTTFTTVAVPTYNETLRLNIFSYLDVSGIFRLKDTTKKYIQLQLGKEINFNDEITLLDIQNIENDLYARNRYRDVFISINVNRTLPSFKDFYLIKLTNEKSCFIQKWVYILFFILTLDKFYELYLDCICSKQFFVIKKIVSSRENVLQNPKYSQFISGYNINEQNKIYERDTIGGIDNEIEVKLPTEEEISLARDYNKYIPQYIMDQNGEVINMNQNSVENLMEIKEENKQAPFHNRNIETQKDEINTNYNHNDINQPLISNNIIELKNQ